jgi:hypothetical protein
MIMANNTPTSDDIDDAVEAWHKSPKTEPISLHAWLGWSEEEYTRWVADPDAIPARPLPNHSA